MHARAGRWRDAVAALDDAAAHRVAAEPRTYNAVIAAAARAGRPDVAAAVHARALAAGAGAGAGALLGGCPPPRAGLARAAAAFADACARGAHRPSAAHAGLAVERGAPRADLPPLPALSAADGVAALLAACGDGAAAAFAPAGSARAAAAAAAGRAGDWPAALAALADAVDSRLPDSDLSLVGAAAIDACLRAGTAAGRSAALSLWAAGAAGGAAAGPGTPSRTPPPRPASYESPCALGGLCGGGLLAGEASTVAAVPPRRERAAPTPGVGLLLALDWLSSARDAARDALAGSSRPPVEGLVLVGAGACARGGRPADGAAAELAAAVSAAIVATRAPVLLRATSSGLLLEVDAGAAPGWATGGAGDAALAPVAAVAATAPPPGHEDAAHREAVVSARCGSALAAAADHEAAHPPAAGAAAAALGGGPARAAAVAALLAVCDGLGAADVGAADAVALFDRAVAAAAEQRAGGGGGADADTPLAPLTLATPPYLAGLALVAADAPGAPPPAAAAAAAAAGCDAGAAAAAAASLSTLLDRDTGVISTVRILHVFLERLGVDARDEAAVAAAAGGLRGAARRALADVALASLPPTFAAAAILAACRAAAGVWPPWPAALASLAGDPGATAPGAVAAARALVAARGGDEPATTT